MRLEFVLVPISTSYKMLDQRKEGLSECPSASPRAHNIVFSSLAPPNSILEKEVSIFQQAPVYLST